MGNNASGLPGMPGKKKDKKKKKYEPPQPTRVGRKKKKGPTSSAKLKSIRPTKQCLLRQTKIDRTNDWLELEHVFITNQVKLKPVDEQLSTEQEQMAELMGTPTQIGTLDEIIDENHAIISTGHGSQYYTNICSFVDKDQLEPGCTIILNNKSMSVVGLLTDDSDNMIDVMKVSKAPEESYADIGGLQTQIMEIKEAVELPLTNPEMYETVGISPPKGVILYGPPGTGKTLLAKAVANHTKATFLRVVGSELIKKYLGEGPKLVRELFKTASENAPCIIFMDEIDAIGAKRYNSNSGGEREIQRTMLELLNQLDGFDDRGEVKVIMATNRIDSLDPALLRPGRIDRKIEFPLPDDKTKKKIFDIQTSKMTLADDVNLDAYIDANSSGADIKAICTEAGLLALRERRKMVTHKDFLKAKDALLSKKDDENQFLYL